MYNVNMKYEINKTNYHSFEIIEENKLPARSYFIPYPGRTSADSVSLKEKRYRSDKVVCLNGTWDFRFYPEPALLPDVFDSDAVDYDKIPVPSCWQFQGYDRPFYLNVRYQFPFRPPIIPAEKPVGKVFDWIGGDHGVGLRWRRPENEYNFVGVYRRHINISDPNKHFVISFLGVASCLDLYCNGTYIGYSEGSHNTAEFDLTGVLHEGENELLCVVHRWCNGSYLECQDMFRSNGIFRDVLLRIDEPSDIFDINAHTEKHGGFYDLTLSADTLSETDVTFTLEGHGISRTATVNTENLHAEICFKDLSVREWNAEEPSLYSVYYQTKGSCVKEFIGFRTVEIKGDVFLLNGHKLKLHGVNHHDTSPTGGYTMTPDEIERDILLCKEFNIDTVRTSHYPPDPFLIELANQLGIYIIDENDLETHGVWAHRLPPSYDRISHNTKWQRHYIDRISRLYGRDKMHANTSIIMWSLGNEAGGFANTDAMYDHLKRRSSLPVHYESVIHDKRVCYDVGSEMYPPVKAVHDVGEHCRKQSQLNDRPYFLCEYAHAMGVGPGNTEAYWQEIYKYDNLMGGCVWEMNDHAVLHSDGRYTYGGDHGEWAHDGNFCVDGLFYPDRAPSTGAWIIKHIYRPIRVKHIEGDTFEVFNTTAFTNAQNYELCFEWNDGTAHHCSHDIAPLEKALIHIPVGKQTAEGRSAVVTVTDLRTQKKVSEEQVIWEPAFEMPSVSALPEGFSIEGGRLQWTLPDGHILTASDPATILFRAGTDNDTHIYHDTMAPFYDQTEQLISCRRTDSGYEVVTRIKNKKSTFTVTDNFSGVTGGVLVTSRLHCERGKADIPRFGKAFRLDECFDSVEYTGRTGESYIDMKDQFPIRNVSCRVSNMTEPNIRPQECGNRTDCTDAVISNGHTHIEFKAVNKSFELAVKPYTDKALIGMRHREDEVRTSTYVTIQAFQQGIGTASCGPGIAPEYRYPADKDYELQFVISIK